MNTNVESIKSNGSLPDRLLDTRVQVANVADMAPTLKELAAQAMDLPADDRAELADLLVTSLDSADLASLERAWADEAHRRSVEVRSGEVTAIPAEEALKQVRASLKR
jgi:putative addiction module component (TIGR02574 family)